MEKSKRIEPAGEIGGLTVYSLSDVAERLNIKIRTLNEYARDGKIRAAKIGGKWYISEESLREYIDGKDSQSAAPAFTEAQLNELVKKTAEILRSESRAEGKK